MKKHDFSIRIVLAVIVIFHSQFVFAGKNNNANPVSNTRARTVANVQGIIEQKPVTEPRKGGYHVGPDTRYQPSKKDWMWQ